VRNPGKDREVGKEPPKDAVAKSPAHARAGTFDVSLKEEAETDSDHDGDREMQKHQIEVGDVERAVAGEQRIVIPGSHPRAENRAADDSGESTCNDCATNVKFGLMRWRMQPSPDAEGQADWSAKAKNVSDEMREAVARVREDTDRRVLKKQANGAVRENNPLKECEAKSPNESSAGACAAARKESTEDHAKDRAVNQRLREGGVNCSHSQCPAGGADEKTDGGKYEQARLRMRGDWRLVIGDWSWRSDRTCCSLCGSQRCVDRRGRSGVC
jgi:hypothetical protein